jgi:DMSO reductase anchor subunit
MRTKDDTMTRFLTIGLLALALTAATAAPVPAAQPLFAAKSSIQKYWDGFKEYWGGTFKNQSAVTLVVVGTGLIALFIITRGKWRK